MSYLKQLSDAQKSQISAWVDAGADLAAIQSHINDDFDLKINYMDTRFLVSDLGLEIKTPAEDEDSAPEDEVVTADSLEQALTQGSVEVSVDEITPPHALISGKVRFSDGGRAMWYIDQSGQLGLDADDPSYRPSEEDVKEFQTKLRELLEKQQGGMM